MKEKEIRTCSISNGGCLAPAGWRTGLGFAHGDKSTRATCYGCGEPVCTDDACSKIMRWIDGKRRRICDTCQDRIRR